MMRFRHSPIVFVSFVCFCGSLHGQAAWSGILDPSRAINWSQAGAPISTTRTQCVTSACATVSSGTTVTAVSINAALASAPAQTYVLLPAGTFSISAAIVIQSPGNVTLRGAGSNSTFLTFTGVSASYSWCANFNLCAASSDTNSPSGPSNTATWTAGYSSGTTSITLKSVSGTAPAVGAPIILDQIDSQTDNGGLYVGCEIYDGSSACYSGAGPNSFERGKGSLTTIRGQQQIVTVTSISGSGSGPYTVGISPGLYAPNWNSGQSPGAWWASNPVHNVGFENFSWTPSSSSSGGMFLFNCQGCWVKGVRATGGPSSHTGWGDVVMQWCNKCTVRDSYFFGNLADDYVIAVDGASDLLVENDIFQFPGTSLFYNSDCEGCVATYNFSAGTLYSGSSNWLAQPADYHGIDLFSLAEGNIGAGLYADSFHGTHDFNTNFRNRWDGRQQNNGNATTSNTLALILNPGTRYQNVVGNILGTPGYHATYKSTPASSANYDVSVIDAGVYPSGSIVDTLVDSTAMYWGNWDNVTNAARFNSSEVPSGLSSYANPVPSSHALPPSFIYSSQPSWWPSGKAWPSIGPDVTGGNVGQCSGGTYNSSEITSSNSSQCSTGGGSFTANSMVVSNPAMDCYFNVMGGVANGTGSPLAFNASACYSSPGGGSLPAPPSNLTAVIH